MIPRPPGSLTKRATQTKLKAGMTGLCESNRFQIMAGGRTCQSQKDTGKGRLAFGTYELHFESYLLRLFFLNLCSK